jgi:hypothetical protein
MQKYRNALEVDFGFDYEPDEQPNDPQNESRVAQRSRANVPPSSKTGVYRVIGAGQEDFADHEEQAERPGPQPPRPMPTASYRRPANPQQPTGYYRQPVPAQRAPVPVRPAQKPAVRPRPQAARSGLISNIWIKVAAFAVGAIVIAWVSYLLVSTGLHAWQTWQDDLTYGRPRTMQIDQFVGHNEQDGAPSHFIAQNNNRQVTVIEYPGGDVSKTRVFPGPRLFGKDAELLPVKLRFEDVNGDKNVDMLISVDNQLIIYINQDGNFRPITAEERSRVKISSANGGNGS